MKNPSLHSETKNSVSFMKSLRSRLIISLLVIILVPLILAGAVIDQSSQRILRSQVEDNLRSRLAIEQKLVQKSLETWENAARTLANNPQIQSMDPQSAAITLNQFALVNPDYNLLQVTGLDGKTIATSDGKAYDFSDREYFKSAQKTQAMTISDPLVSKANDAIVVVFFTPVRRNSVVVGYAGVSVPLSILSDLFPSSYTGESDEVYLIDRHRYVIASSRYTERVKADQQEGGNGDLQANSNGAFVALAGHEGVSEYTGYTGHDVLGAYAPIKKTGWGLLAEQETAEAFADLEKMRLFLAAVLAGMLLLVMAGGWAVVTFGISRPLRILTEAALVLAGGDLRNPRLERSAFENVARRSDELGAIGRAFQGLVRYLTNVAEAAERIASGDLSDHISPESETDVLGNAFVRMVDGLRIIVFQVVSSGRELKSASSQLNQAYSRSENAVSRITESIQQMAQGASEQSAASTRTAEAVSVMGEVVGDVTQKAALQNQEIGETLNEVQALNAAVGDVYRGAEKQNEAVLATHRALLKLMGSAEELYAGAEVQKNGLNQAVASSGELGELFSGVTDDAREITLVSDGAIRNAEQGKDVVGETARAVDIVRLESENLAQKIEELYRYSDQIGVIVDAILEISGQTKLLSLNAAIEAARAGVSGRGFAVVADEVRKLSEKSTQASVEINQILKNIQRSAQETSQAMTSVTGNIQTAVDSTRRAQTSFEDIAGGTARTAERVSSIVQGMDRVMLDFRQRNGILEEAYHIAERNAGVAEEISAISAGLQNDGDTILEVARANHEIAVRIVELCGGLSKRLETVSAIATEHTNVTDRMRSNTDVVWSMIENVAVVAKQNAGAHEAISSAVEEVNAQVEEVASSVITLSELASFLNSAVEQFTIDEAVPLQIDDVLQSQE